MKCFLGMETDRTNSDAREERRVRDRDEKEFNVAWRTGPSKAQNEK